MREAADDIEIDDGFRLLELVGWSAAGLDAALDHSRLPVPPAPGKVATADGAIVLRLTPRIGWVIAEPRAAAAWDLRDDAVGIDLSNSRVRLRVRGQTGHVLSRLIAVDLVALPRGRFVSSLVRGIPITVLPAANGFDAYVPRSFCDAVAGWIRAHAE